MVVIVAVFTARYALRFSARRHTVEPGYNDIGLYDISPVESDILWYQLIRHC
jgi:hypothetical protein